MYRISCVFLKHSSFAYFPSQEKRESDSHTLSGDTLMSPTSYTITEKRFLHLEIGATTARSLETLSVIHTEPGGRRRRRNSWISFIFIYWVSSESAVTFCNSQNSDLGNQALTSSSTLMENTWKIKISHNVCRVIDSGKSNLKSHLFFLMECTNGIKGGSGVSFNPGPEKRDFGERELTPLV
ncbi:hypothetical protein CDAR_421311 [Caerostris darwini]|uniref:Uncharacterized protein n=1 Tax=Caerostris darwini TaxID=1538125 RepID=A0AAV4S843_9ARAC|nr:hypothetical protein CDAR_421311 [Caerostris darwini]